MLFRLSHQFQDFIFALIVRIRVQQLLPGGESFVDIHLALPLDDAQIEQGVGLVGLVRQRFLELCDGGIGVAGVPIGGRHVRTNSSVGGLHLQRTLVIINRGGKLLGIVIDVANTFQKAGIIGICGELGDQRRSLCIGHFLHLRRSWGLRTHAWIPGWRNRCARRRSRRWTLGTADKPAAGDSHQQADDCQHVSLHACPLLSRSCSICIRHFLSAPCAPVFICGGSGEPHSIMR